MSESNGDLANFFTESRPRYYRSGEIILHPDDNHSRVFCIEKGYVKSYSITEDGEEKIHVIYKQDEIFPWIWIFRDSSKPVFYETLGEVILRVASREGFLNFFEKSCSSKKDKALLFELAEKITTALDVHVDRINNLSLTKAYPRLVTRLLSLARRFGRREGNEVVLDVPIGHKDIANSINMSRETASRELEKLVKKGLIRCNRDHLLIITDINKLREELEKKYERELFV